MFFQNSEGYSFQGLPLLLCLCVCCLRPSVLRLITNTVDSSFEPTGVLYMLVSFLVLSSMLSGPFCRQPLTYACKKCFLPPGLIFSQTQAFCFTQANPKCLEMPCFILTLLEKLLTWEFVVNHCCLIVEGGSCSCPVSVVLQAR